MDDVLGYAGKRVIVTGAASGTGAATAKILVDLGAEVHAIDLRKPEQTGLASFTETDLREPDQIDTAVDKIGSVVNALFNCARSPSGSSVLDVMLVGFCGVRHLTERVVSSMIEGSAIVHLAPATYPSEPGAASALVATPDFESARAWCETNAERVGDEYEPYEFTARAVDDLTVERSMLLAFDGIRVNCLNVGPWRAPKQHAWPLLFLNSARASSLTGLALDADRTPRQR